MTTTLETSGLSVDQFNFDFYRHHELIISCKYLRKKGIV